MSSASAAVTASSTAEASAGSASSVATTASASDGHGGAGGAGGDGGSPTASSGGGGGSAPTSSSSGAGGAGGEAPPLLGAAHSFVILGGTTVTNVGMSSITGDLGVSPGTSITGIPRDEPDGTNHGDDAVSDQAQFDATMAYNALMVPACDVTRATGELGGLTLGPGVHCFDTEAVHLAGPLILDTQGDPDARFIFRVRAAFTTSSFASVTMIDGAPPCGVYWLVGTSATIGEGSLFAGTILAKDAITLSPGVRLAGRAIARNAALTMDSNSVSVALCD